MSLSDNKIKTSTNMTDTNHLVSLLDEATSIAVIPAKTAGADSFCAAAGMYYMLKRKFENNASKNIKFVYSGKIPDPCTGIIKDDEVTSNLAERELLVSIDYSNTPATGASYSTENDIIYFKIAPVSKNFDMSRIKTRLTGYEFDLVITIGARELADLGPIYNNLRFEIEQSRKVNIDNSKKNSRYGVVNVLDDTCESLSEMVLKYAGQWNLTVDKKGAKALLTGVTHREPVVKS